MLDELISLGFNVLSFPYYVLSNCTKQQKLNNAIKRVVKTSQQQRSQKEGTFVIATASTDHNGAFKPTVAYLNNLEELAKRHTLVSGTVSNKEELRLLIHLAANKFFNVCGVLVRAHGEKTSIDLGDEDCEDFNGSRTENRKIFGRLKRGAVIILDSCEGMNLGKKIASSFPHFTILASKKDLLRMTIQLVVAGVWSLKMTRKRGFTEVFILRA
jgi:hypothetical protein